MFNVGLGEIVAIVLVCLVVFGPERLPGMARQTGRVLGQLRLAAQGALDQVKQDADLRDANLPDLHVGSLRTQARDYVGRLLDIDGQMAELQQARSTITAELADPTNPQAETPTAAHHPNPPPVDPEAS